MHLDWGARQAAVARAALSLYSYGTDTGEERALIAGMLAALRKPDVQEASVDDGYDLLAVRIKRGTTINGAVVALCPVDGETIVTADVCIDGPPVP